MFSAVLSEQTNYLYCTHCGPLLVSCSIEDKYCLLQFVSLIMWWLIMWCAF